MLSARDMERQIAETETQKEAKINITAAVDRADVGEKTESNKLVMTVANCGGRISSR